MVIAPSEDTPGDQSLRYSSGVLWISMKSVISIAEGTWLTGTKVRSASWLLPRPVSKAVMWSSARCLPAALHKYQTGNQDSCPDNVANCFDGHVAWSDLETQSTSISHCLDSFLSVRNGKVCQIKVHNFNKNWANVKSLSHTHPLKKKIHSETKAEPREGGIPHCTKS